MKFRIRDHYTHWTGKVHATHCIGLIGAENFSSITAFHLTQVSGKGQENWGSHGDPCSVPASSRAEVVPAMLAICTVSHRAEASA
jgi:hypothetical protein